MKSELITSVAAAVSGNDIVINNTDFEARFDGNVWSVKWHWKDCRETTPVLFVCISVVVVW